MNREEFGIYLARRRKKELGIKSLTKMASIIGMSVPMLSKIETGGVKNPGIETTYKIAKGYQLKHELVLSIFSQHALMGDNDELHLDRILDKIRSDPRFKNIADRSASENRGRDTKLYIIKLYEELTGTKYLNTDADLMPSKD